MSSKWVIHYHTLAPETVLVDQKYFGTPASYTVGGIEAALRSGDVQHVTASGALQQGASYWAPGAVKEYELVETDEQGELTSRQSLLAAQSELAAAAQAALAAEKAAQLAADEARVSEQALELAASAREEAEAEVAAASTGSEGALAQIALKSAEAAKVVEAVKAANADALRRLADANSKLHDAQLTEAAAERKRTQDAVNAQALELAVQQAASKLAAAARKAAEAGRQTVTPSAGAPEGESSQTGSLPVPQADGDA